MSFVMECIKDSLPVWKKCLETPFLRALAEGTLDPELMKGYIVDDSLYLREYAKVFGWGIIHSRTMEEVRAFSSLLTFVNESEDATRLVYLSRFGLDDGRIQQLPLRMQNREYADTMLTAARSGGTARCIMACLPCMLSYSWIFRELVKSHPNAADSEFGELINDYANDDYARLCSLWTARAEEFCTDLDEAEKYECRQVFRKCSQHEYDFWIMSGEKRTDL